MCENCPVKCGLCIADRFNAKNLCDHMDPANAKYNPAYEKIIVDKSCGSNDYVVQSSAPAEQPSKSMPSLWQQVKNFTSATVEHLKDGMKQVEQEEFLTRIKICESCEFFDNQNRRCARCGCYMDKKAIWRTSECPIGKW